MIRFLLSLCELILLRRLLDRMKPMILETSHEIFLLLGIDSFKHKQAVIRLGRHNKVKRAGGNMTKQYAADEIVFTGIDLDLQT